MSAATEFDVGPLTWVKGEIDQALERAGAALDEFEKNGEVTQFKFCRTHVHPVHGALEIVGLSGVTELTEAGFSTAEIHKAFDWLGALAEQRPATANARAHGPTRVYFGPELDKLDVECRGFLLFLEQQGILVRHYNKPGLTNCIRISVGRPDQSERLLAALRHL